MAEESLFSDTHITQRYMRRYGETARVRSWHGKLVHIRTENGVWRTNGHGYTFAGEPDAWVLLFEDAVKQIAHCGPEKQGAFLIPPSKADQP